jgi:hypothetical protein
VIKRHYDKFGATVELRPEDREETVHHTVIVLVARPTRASAHAIRYAQALRADHLFALTVIHDPTERPDVEHAWQQSRLDVPLEIIDDPYRDFAAAIEAFLDQTDARWHDDTITVIIPEFVVSRWWEHLLHNQSALALKARLLYRHNTVVTSVPWHLD